MNDPVETSLAAAFPDRSVEELVGVGPSWNGGNETVGVDFADGERAYLKVAIEGDGSRIARERAVVEYVAARRPIPVPAVLAAEPTGEPPYLATASAPGRDLFAAFEEAGTERREALLGGVGETLATLHAERFPHHGEIGGRGAVTGREETTAVEPDDGQRPANGPGLDVATASWTDTLLATIERTREIGTTDRLARHFDAVIDCVRTNRTLLDEAPAALVHGDIAKPNGFVVDGDGRSTNAEVGLIDWELAHVGDPVRDLVRARDQLCNGFDTEGPSRLGDAVYEGYRSRAGGLPEGFEARRPIYRVVRVLGRSGFLDQWATYLDEPVADLVDRIDAELNARLEAVSSEA
ncbi:MAG: putative aminoglycoside phosphotransferase [uncultured archaeon A07HR67]|nr:MAG: putative aminoglycoside phosphotransferase [uncultured archaeon A07HR67]